MYVHLATTECLPLCRPAGWAALWRRLANCAALNA